jgi:hypothetical protein
MVFATEPEARDSSIIGLLGALLALPFSVEVI